MSEMSVGIARRPALLMVSHCVPERWGTPERRRSWQLLEAAARTHRVWLAAVADDAVNLAQWREAARRAEAVTLMPRVASRWMRGGEGGDAGALPSAYGGMAFEAALCTSARLWPTVEAATAGLRICDFGGEAARHDRPRAEAAGVGLRWWRDRRPQAWHAREQAAAARCDVLLVAQAQDAARWAERGGGVCVVPPWDAGALTDLLRGALSPSVQPQREAGLGEVAQAA